MTDKAIERARSGELVEKSFIHYLPVVVVGILLCGVPSAIMTSCAGIYYPVIAKDMGVPIQDVSMWRTLSYITGCIFAPVAGAFFARHNAKWILLAASAVESLCVASFGIAPNVYPMWVAGAIIGFTNTIILAVSISVLINRWFRVHVSILIGICTAFTGAGALVFIPIGQHLIDTVGWRQSYITLGLFSLVVMTVAILLLLANKPEDKGMLPYGTARAIKAAQENGGKAQDVRLSVRPSVALRSPVFWLVIVLALFLNTAVNVNSFFASYVSFYNEQVAVVSGVAAATFVTGASLTSFCMGGMAIGKVGLGFFSDIDIRFALVVMLGCGALGLLFIWQFPTTPLLPVGGFIFGFLVPGAIVFTPMLVRTVFGDGASYPILIGYVMFAINGGGAIATYCWPALADALGGFDAVFGLAIGIMAVVLVLGFIVYHMKDTLPREPLTEEDLGKKK